MTDLPSDIQPRVRRPAVVSRSKGAKLLIVCVLAVLMSIPAGFVFLLLLDRTHRAEAVSTEIGGLVGGPQTFLGPVVAVPYIIPPKTETDAQGVRTVTPQLYLLRDRWYP